MKKQNRYPTQYALMLRLMAGGYLLYTAWDIRKAVVEESPLFIIAIVAFAVIGIALLIHAGKKLWKGEFEGGRATMQPETEEVPAIGEETAAE